MGEKTIFAILNFFSSKSSFILLIKIVLHPKNNIGYIILDIYNVFLKIISFRHFWNVLDFLWFKYIDCNSNINNIEIIVFE